MVYTLPGNYGNHLFYTRTESAQREDFANIKNIKKAPIINWRF